MDYDHNFMCMGSKHIAIAAVSLLIIFVFNILPALLLVLYPFKIIRFCLFKCRFNMLHLNAFVDKFHSCYRNGLNGDKDMRSFAGLYFLLRGFTFLYYPCKLYKIDFSFGSYMVLLFLSATLLVAIVRPYKERYMNIFDTLILGHFTFMSKMQTDNYSKGMGTQLFILNLIPAFALGICLSYVKIYKVYNFRCCRRWGPRARGDNPWPYQSTSEDDIFDNSGTKNKSNMTSSRDIETQPLLTPTAD